MNKQIRELQAARIIKRRTGHEQMLCLSSIAAQRPGEFIISERVRKARTVRNMTQAEFARAAGYTNARVSRLEQNDPRIMLRSVKHIAAVLNVNPWYLTGDSEVMECE